MKIYFILLISLVILISLIGCSPTTLIINENNQKDKYSVKKGDILEVILNTNPSTGYEWTIVNIDTSKLNIVDEKYTPKIVNDKIVGSGGSKTHIFKSIDKGKTTVDFIYSRPFEKELPPKKKFHVNLEIK